MIEPPRLVQTEAQPMAYVHVLVPRERIREVMGPGIGEVAGALAAQGIAPTGPWFCQHLRMAPDVFDFRICMPVSTPVTPTGRVQAGVLRATEAVRTVYVGPYEGLGAAWAEFDALVSAAGYATAPDLWETYLKGPESGDDPSTYRTELTHPLAGRGGAIP